MNSITDEPQIRRKACIVPGCKDKTSVRRRFPRKIEENYTFHIWLDRINNPKLFNMPKAKICDNYVVCDRHFEEDCKIPGYRRLWKGSVPTLFLPNKEDCTEVYNIEDRPIDLPSVAEDCLDHQLVDSTDLLLNSDSLNLHTVEAQDTFLSTLFNSTKQYSGPLFPSRVPEGEKDVNNTDNIELNDDDWVEVFYLDETIDFSTSDIIKIEVDDTEELEEVEELGEIEQGGELEELEQAEEVEPVGPPILEKPYFKSVKSYLVDSRSMTEVCRICFRSILDQEMTKLYEEDNIEEANNIRNMLKLVLPDLDLEIYPNSVVCTRCQKLLFYSYKLKETWLTTEEKLQKIIDKKKGVTNRDADLVLVAKAVAMNNCTDKVEKCSKDKIDRKENRVEINSGKSRNKVMEQNLDRNESATDLEVSDCHSDLSNNVAKELNVSVNKNKNLCNKNVFSGGQENDIGINPAKLRSKLMQQLLKGKDSTIDREVSECRSDLNTENLPKEPDINLNSNEEPHWCLENENDFEIKPVKVTNKVVRDILSHNDSGATNLEVTIYHGDLENSLQTSNTDFNQYEDIFSAENDIERPAEVMQDISNQNDNAAIGSVNSGDLETEILSENRNPSDINENKNKRGRMIWGLGPYMCEKCGRVFHWLMSLRRHLKTHIMDSQPKKPRIKMKKETMCELCGQLFTNARCLSMHREKHDRKLDCSICDKVFKHSRALELHVRRAHMGEYDYSQCHLCGKQLSYQASLRLHLLRHAAERPHTCQICDKRFLFPSNLKKHLRKHGDALFSCQYCGKAMKYQHTLQKHIRIYHHDEAEFRCDYCRRPYWKKVDLIKHKIRIHGWRPEPEPV